MRRFSRLFVTLPVPITAGLGFGFAKETSTSSDGKSKSVHISANTQSSSGSPINLPRYIDHTALKPETTRDDIEKLCTEAKHYGFASVCINPYHVPYAFDLLRSSQDVKLCTVIGFPLGGNTTFTKCCETVEAILNGASEIDFVANIGMIKSDDWDKVGYDMACIVLAAKYTYQWVNSDKTSLSKSDVAAIAYNIATAVDEMRKNGKVKKLDKIFSKFGDLTNFVEQYDYGSAENLKTKNGAEPCLVKVILETSLLSDDEIVRACQIAVQSKCDYVKTSTGFSTGGATVDHVALMKNTVDKESKKNGWKEGTVKVKASGGIRNAKQAREMIDAGADRIGVSKGVDIVKEDMKAHGKK